MVCNLIFVVSDIMCLFNLNRHKPCKSATGHNFKCSHPFGNAHVIFVCDISGSMSSGDGGNSRASYKFIKDSGSLDNRLGALYSAIHKFVQLRLAKGCSDKVSAVMTPGFPANCSNKLL